MTIKVHRGYTDSGEAYDASQTDESIADGDVLVTQDGRVAILVKAWPTQVDGPPDGEFHRLNAETTWDTIDGGRYQESATAARRIIANSQAITPVTK